MSPLQFPFSPSSATPSPNSHPHPTSTADDGYNPVIKQSSTHSLYSTLIAHASGDHNCGNFYITNAFIVNDIYMPHKQKVRPTLNSRPNLPWFRSHKLDHLFYQMCCLALDCLLCWFKSSCIMHDDLSLIPAFQRICPICSPLIY